MSLSDWNRGRSVKSGWSENMWVQSVQQSMKPASSAALRSSWFPHLPQRGACWVMSSSCRTQADGSIWLRDAASAEGNVGQRKTHSDCCYSWRRQQISESKTWKSNCEQSSWAGPELWSSQRTFSLIKFCHMKHPSISNHPELWVCLTWRAAKQREAARHS